MSRTWHVTAFGSWDADRQRLVIDDETRGLAWLRTLHPGAGERFVVRVEREADAKRYHQLKWYYGYIVKQCAENGNTVPEMDLMFRALFMPGDVDTLSLMTYDQMHDFMIQCEQYAAEVIGVVIEGPRDSFLAA